MINTIYIFTSDHQILNYNKINLWID